MQKLSDKILEAFGAEGLEVLDSAGENYADTIDEYKGLPDTETSSADMATCHAHFALDGIGIVPTDEQLALASDYLQTAYFPQTRWGAIVAQQEEERRG